MVASRATCALQYALWEYAVPDRKMGSVARSIRHILGEETPVNRYYGHDAVLKRYARVRLPYIVPGEIQHGWHADAGIYGDLTQHTEAEKMARRYVWNRRNLERALDCGYRNTVAIGAPFLYLPGETTEAASGFGERSLLLFPFHTWEREPFIDPVHTYRDYIQEIRELRNAFSPITVCLYWIQYENPDIVRLFEENGLQVTTLGHRDDNPTFLHKFRSLAANHEHVSSNSLSTAVFYALYMRKKAFLFGHPPYSEVRWLPTANVADTGEHAALYTELGWKDFDNRSHYWVGETELGLEFKRTPAELRRLFRWNAAAWAGGCSQSALREARCAARNSPTRIRQAFGALTGRRRGHRE